MKKTLFTSLAVSVIMSVAAAAAFANTPKALEVQHSTKVKTQKECCFKCCGIIPLSPKK